MNELLWTLSLVAQHRLAAPPPTVPASGSDEALTDPAQAIAPHFVKSLLPLKIGSAVELGWPEFSALKGDRPSVPIGNHAGIHKPPKARDAVLVGDRPSNQTALPQDLTHLMSLTAGALPVSNSVRPTSGSQLYAQRWAALRAGKTYTRLPADSFQDLWQSATDHPHYEDWLHLLAQEAAAMARGQGQNRLTVILGDSLSQWFPNDHLPSDRFWLNQGISGDTSAGVLRRLALLDGTRPDVIHLMVGINDLRGGATDAELLANLQQIMQNLQQRHPTAQIYVHSLLPTRLPAIPNSRITNLNQAIAQIAQQEAVAYLDLQANFADEEGNLRRDLTTDGLHLSPQGYALWHSALRWLQLA
jgi:lysophospholipase L1-like esterase